MCVRKRVFFCGVVLSERRSCFELETGVVPAFRGCEINVSKFQSWSAYTFDPRAVGEFDDGPRHFEPWPIDADDS
ncbi:hypothetical protein TNCV_1627801 [Trichonephila clavipes]|nr:hypothetical protein TNCV_1627801 [Trichonephila clavipes]